MQQRYQAIIWAASLVFSWTCDKHNDLNDSPPQTISLKLCLAWCIGLRPVLSLTSQEDLHRPAGCHTCHTDLWLSVDVDDILAKSVLLWRAWAYPQSLGTVLKAQHADQADTNCLVLLALFHQRLENRDKGLEPVSPIQLYCNEVRSFLRHCLWGACEE